MKAYRLLLCLSSLALLASCGGNAPSSSSSSSSASSSVSSSSEKPAESSSTSEKLSSSESSSQSSKESSSSQSAESSLSPEESSSSEEAASSEESSIESSSQPESSESSSEEAKIIRAYLFDEGGLLKKITKKSSSDAEFVDITLNIQTDGNVSFYEIEEGADVLLTLENNDRFELVDVLVNGEDSYKANEGLVSFKAAASIGGFMNITINANPVVPEGYDIAFTANNSDHITLSFYASDKVTEIFGGMFDQQIYVKATSSEERYSVRSLTYTYFTGSTGSRNSGELSVDEDGFASFKVPYEGKGVTESGIAFAVTELDAEAYSESSFVGTYIGVEFGSGDTPRKLSELSKYELTISASGEIVNNTRRDYITDLRGDDEMYTANYSSLYYGNDMLLANTSSSDHLGTPYVKSYDSLFVKKASADDSIEDYSIRSVRYLIEGKSYFVAAFYHNDAFYKGGYVDVAAKTAYFDVAFDFINGESLFDEKAFYSIIKGEEQVAGFTYVGQGGVDQMQVALNWYGRYSGENSSTLVVLNSKDALYNGSPYVIKPSENNYVLSNGTLRITVSLDLTARSFAVLNTEADTGGVPDFRGLTFTGTFVDGWGDDNAGSVVFDSYDSDDSISGVVNYGPAGMSWNHPFTFTATFDLATKVLSMTVTKETYNEGVVGKTVRANCETGKITFVDNFSSYYAAKNCVFTCASFVVD